MSFDSVNESIAQFALNGDVWHVFLLIQILCNRKRRKNLMTINRITNASKQQPNKSKKIDRILSCSIIHS